MRKRRGLRGFFWFFKRKRSAKNGNLLKILTLRPSKINLIIHRNWSYQNESHDKNITIVKNCVFVRNKSLIKMCLTSNCWFWLKHKSSNHYIAFSSEKKSTHLIWIRREICTDNKHCLQRKQSKTFKNKYICRFCYERTTGDWLLYFGSVILDYRLAFCLNDGFVSYKHAAYFDFTKH